MKSKRDSKSRQGKTSRRRSIAMLYLFIAMILILIAYFLYQTVTPQLTSFLANMGSTSANASKTAMVNFVYVK